MRDKIKLTGMSYMVKRVDVKSIGWDCAKL